jgi:hypothetical protein
MFDNSSINFLRNPFFIGDFGEFTLSSCEIKNLSYNDYCFFYFDWPLYSLRTVFSGCLFTNLVNVGTYGVVISTSNIISNGGVSVDVINCRFEDIESTKDELGSVIRIFSGGSSVVNIINTSFILITGVGSTLYCNGSSKNIHFTGCYFDYLTSWNGNGSAVCLNINDSSSVIEFNNCFFGNCNAHGEGSRGGMNIFFC